MNHVNFGMGETAHQISPFNTMFAGIAAIAASPAIESRAAEHRTRRALRIMATSIMSLTPSHWLIGYQLSRPLTGSTSILLSGSSRFVRKFSVPIDMPSCLMLVLVLVLAD
jgi:hypothetical protein